MGGIISLRADRAIDRAVRALAFAHWFGLGAGMARTLSALFEAQGKWLPIEALAENVHVSRGAVIVRISRLREAMECEAIDSSEGEGYRLTDVGIAECKVAILSFRDSLDGTIREAAE